MKRIAAVIILCWAQIAAGAATKPAGRTGLSRRKIVEVMRRVNAYQAAHPWKRDDRNWIRATYYTGVMALHETTGDPKFLNQAIAWATKHKWAEGSERHVANKKTCGQTYLQLYFLKKDPARIAKMRAYVDRRIAKAEAPTKVWYYCDALYVGPPTLAMLGKVTGQRKYYDYLNKMYWSVTDLLLDKTDGLFYRDKRFIGKQTARGRKIFWSRGNGWVIGGIPRVLRYLPKDDPQYGRYVKLLRTMAAAIAKVQGADGLWRSNLGDSQEHPGPETSGSAFFCYAMAWGINNSLLDREKYLPVVTKAWRGLVRCVGPDGKLGYVQPVGDRPRPAAAGQTHEYAMGAFLLAGSEMVKLVGPGGAAVQHTGKKLAHRGGRAGASAMVWVTVGQCHPSTKQERRRCIDTRCRPGHNAVGCPCCGRGPCPAFPPRR